MSPEKSTRAATRSALLQHAQSDGLSRTRERVIDLVATVVLLGFAWLFNGDTPGLSGVVIAAAIQFWLTKNATRLGEHGDG